MRTTFPVFDRLPEYENATGCYDCNDGCAMLYSAGVEEWVYTDYIQKLNKSGFKCCRENELQGNLYATYTGAGLTVQICYVPSEKALRIVADPHTAGFDWMPKRAERPEKTKLYQMELDFRAIDCGMCYIVKCDDGSFFVIDSAHMNSTQDHIRIHDMLKKLNGEKAKIKIAGWFFSHAHQDHIVKFMDFIEFGFDDYEIEKVYYTFPALHIPGSEHWSESDKETMREFDALMDRHPELCRVKLHTGQRFYVRNLQFDVLATHEDIYPQPLNHFNDSSTVLLMEAEGEKVLWLGDAGTVESDILERRYGALLASGIVQVAHHGFHGATAAVYELAKGKVLLFSTSSKHYAANLYREANQKAIALCREKYIAGDGTVELMLPYEPGTARVWDREIADD